MTTLDWLQLWYQRACNGTWEHSYGIKIDTLDNPGWHIHVDLAGTPYANYVVRQTNVENSETDWLRCSLYEDRFEGYGDAGKLEQIIQVFKAWVEPAEV